MPRPNHLGDCELDNKCTLEECHECPHLYICVNCGMPMNKEDVTFPEGAEIVCPVCIVRSGTFKKGGE